MNRRAAVQRKVVVIGAGFGGLATAIRLAVRGYAVHLVDRIDGLGGRARTFVRGEYRYDAGPTVLTAPFLFDELFELAGESRADHVELLPVDPWYRMRFADGSHFDYGDTLAKTLAEVRRLSPGDVAGYLRLGKQAKRRYEIAFERYGTHSFESVGSMFAALPKLAALRADRSVWQHVSRQIGDDRLRRALSVHPLLVGGSPFATSSLYSLIHHVELEWGIWYPRGGMGAMVDALGGLLARLGVEVTLGRSVEKIEVRDGNVSGVVLDDRERIATDCVVCDGDPAAYYSSLVAPEHRRRWTDARIGKLEFSMGLFVAYFTVAGRTDDIAHHTILFDREFESHLSAIFDSAELTGDLNLYLHRPAATDPSMAPAGKDSFYVLSPVPNLANGADWNVLGEAYRDAVLARIEATVLPGLRSRLEDCFHLSPQYFRDELGSMHGAGFSVAPTLRQSAWFRFHNRSEDVSGLYFVGAGTHPGAGVPGVLTSAKIVDRLITAESRSRAA